MRLKETVELQKDTERKTWLAAHCDLYKEPSLSITKQYVWQEKDYFSTIITEDAGNCRFPLLISLFFSKNNLDWRQRGF